MKKKKCDICGELSYLDKHHITSKSKNGTNEKYNIINVCPNCHRLIHAGDIIVEGKFMTTTGIVLLWHKKDEESITNFKPDCFILGK